MGSQSRWPIYTIGTFAFAAVQICLNVVHRAGIKHQAAEAFSRQKHTGEDQSWM